MISKSTIDNRQSTILSPIYFPFTFISPSLVEAMAFFFHRVAVYQPAYAKTAEALRPWMESGFLDVRSPFEKVIQRKPLEAALRNFKSWGHFHQDADMAYLKTVGNNIAPVDPQVPRIVSDIRAMGAKDSKEFEDSELSLQVFLHLSQEFDQHSWELMQQLNRFNEQYEALQSSFRQDQNGETQEPSQKERFPVEEEDIGSLVIEKRMATWNHLFQKDPAGSSLLFTDSHSALAYLLDEVQEKVEALKFNITYTQAESNQVAKDHPTWADHLQELFNMVLRTPWTPTLQERVVQAGREIEGSIDHWRGSAVKSHDKSVSFRWYVVPHVAARGLLNQRCGVDSAREEDVDTKVKNTLLGLIQEGRPPLL